MTLFNPLTPHVLKWSPYTKRVLCAVQKHTSSTRRTYRTSDALQGECVSSHLHKPRRSAPKESGGTAPLCVALRESSGTAP